VEKSTQKILGYLCNFQKLPKVNNRPIGENSPNLTNGDFLQASQWLHFAPSIQGDQIGRKFVHWVVVYLDQFYSNDRSGRKNLATFFNGVSYALILTKNGLGYIFVRFFYKLVWSPCFGCNPGDKQLKFLCMNLSTFIFRNFVCKHELRGKKTSSELLGRTALASV
jgi:hypothetical protein